jgi:tRNA threonylcarbamoyladenosine biosynthesis protein TsaB
MPNLPRILAIETSGRTGSVALALGPTLLTSRQLPPTSRHAAELMPAIQELTREQSWQPGQIDQLYLSLGPGSFTGLRIAVALARAMHQATGCKLIGIPSLDIIAQNAPPEFHLVLPILDAKRSQVFAARYQRDASGELNQSPPAASAALVDPAAFVRQAIELAGTLLAQNSNLKTARGGGNSKLKIALLGEGLDYHRDALFTSPLPPTVELTELPKPLWPATAANLHQLGYHRARQNQFSNPQTLLPLYIRLPEAEEVYRKKHNLPL